MYHCILFNAEKASHNEIICILFNANSHLNFSVCCFFSQKVDGETNEKLQSVHVQDFPISTAHFTGDGTEVVMCGERKSYYIYDMMAGKISRICGIRG